MAAYTELLEMARAAARERDWPRAREAYLQADRLQPLEASDVFALADCAWWLGRIDEALPAYERAHRLYLDAGEPAKAAKAALLLGAHAMERGEHVIGAAWMNRARRLLADAPTCAEHGYPLYFDLFASMGRGDLDEARVIAQRMQELGGRFDDPNLVALGVMGEGRVLLKRGDARSGMALLDEAMLAAVSDELHPVWTGGIYCHLMDVCHELLDVQRAGEWTQAAESWCDGVAEAVLYRGICRVHRAQVLQRQGAWSRAEQLAERASADLRGVHVGSVAEAHYEMGEIHRLRGDLVAAKDCYERAHDLGRDPQPGIALVWVAEGRADAAVTTLRSVMAGRGDRLGRVRIAAALVDAALAADAIHVAREACSDLSETADAYDSPGLHALEAQARGAVLLADDRTGDAITLLRTAVERWHELDAPYDTARTRVLLAQAYRASGDVNAASLELAAAHRTFRQLGAVLDARDAARMRDGGSRPDGLTPREVEVLRELATGRTNQQVAAELHISDKTVARHLANTYRKLDVSTRSAATAYAFEHGLVDGQVHRSM